MDYYEIFIINSVFKIELEWWFVIGLDFIMDWRNVEVKFNYGVVYSVVFFVLLFSKLYLLLVVWFVFYGFRFYK